LEPLQLSCVLSACLNMILTCGSVVGWLGGTSERTGTERTLEAVPFGGTHSVSGPRPMPAWSARCASPGRGVGRGGIPPDDGRSHPRGGREGQMPSDTERPRITL